MNKSIVEKMEESRGQFSNLMILLIVVLDMVAIYIFADISDSEPLFSGIEGVIFISINVAIVIIYFWTGARLSRMIKKSGMTESELDSEYQNARELIKDKAYVGEQYLFYMDEMFTGLIKVDETVWVCSRLHWGGRNFTQRLIYLYIYTVDRKRYKIFCDDADAVVAYFYRNVPHVIVGNSWRLSLMFWFNHKKFLDLKYNKKLCPYPFYDEGEHERKSEKQI